MSCIVCPFVAFINTKMLLEKILQFLWSFVLCDKSNNNKLHRFFHSNHNVINCKQSILPLISIELLCQCICNFCQILNVVWKKWHLHRSIVLCFQPNNNKLICFFHSNYYFISSTCSIVALIRNVLTHWCIWKFWNQCCLI